MITETDITGEPEGKLEVDPSIARAEKIAMLICRAKVQRSFPTEKSFDGVVRSALTNGALFLEETPRRTMFTNGQGDTIGIHPIETMVYLSRKEHIYKSGSYTARRKLEEELHDFATHKGSHFYGNLVTLVEEGLTKPPKIFQHEHFRYELEDIKLHGNDDEGILMAKHLATIIVATALSDWKTRSGVTSTLRAMIKRFLKEGTISDKPPEKVELDNPVFHEPGLVYEIMDGVKWRFKKYCPSCGTMDRNYYSADIENGMPMHLEARVTDFECWDCYEKKIMAAMTQDYNGLNVQACKDTLEEFGQYYFENAINEYDDNRKEWDEIYSPYMTAEVSHVDEFQGEKTTCYMAVVKKLSKEMAAYLLKNMQNDYEGPDDQTDCPIWEE